MDESVWASEPYTQQDLTNQVNYGLTHCPYGPQIYSDARTTSPASTPTSPRPPTRSPRVQYLPGEYAAIGRLPQPFTLEDLVSIATLVGGIFGNGGGDQLQNAVLYEDMERKFGREHANVAGSPERVRHARRRIVSFSRGRHKRRRTILDRSGFATFLSFDDPNDPESPTTVHGKKFRYQTLPRPSKAVRRTLALPDAGSVQFVNHVVAGAPPAGSGLGGLPIPGAKRGGSRRPAHPIANALGPAANAGPGMLAFPGDMSNALLDQRQAQRERSSAGRDGAAGGVLLARDPHGGGHPRAGNRC